MTSFNKPAFDIEQQLNALRQRGLSIPDEVLARHYLESISQLLIYNGIIFI